MMNGHLDGIIIGMKNGKKKNNVKNTIEIVEALGMRPRNIDNIQCACERINFSEGEVCKEIYKSLSSWSKNIENDKNNLNNLFNK